MTNRTAVPLAGLTTLALSLSTLPAFALQPATAALSSSSARPADPGTTQLRPASGRSDRGPSEIDGESSAGDAESSTGDAGFHLDVETDPTAFILSGYSFHVGAGYGRFRLDLGGFAMQMPEFMHGNAGFRAKFAGAGAKLQYFFSAAGDARGAFVGADAGVARLSVEREDSGRGAKRTVSSVGVLGGYRFTLSSRRKSPGKKPTYRPFEGAFYVTPWIGVGYLFGDTRIEADEKSFNLSRVSFFPAVHVGYGFD
jgi:hypothetical protein